MKKPFTQEEDCWESDLDTVEGCSKAPEKITIWIKPLAKVQIDALMEKYPNIEWFAYLIGDGTDMYTVEELLIPEQTVTATSVDDIICEDFNKLNCIGAMHSHHGMGTGFSGTDHAFVNQNHDISLVVATNKIAGQVRWKTPCGCLKIVDAEVKPKIEVDFDKKAFLKTLPKLINEKKFVTQTPVVHQSWVNGVGVPTNPPGTGKNLNPAQKQYAGGVSVKEIAEAAAKEKAEKEKKSEEAEAPAEDTTDLTETVSDDCPEIPEEQSLMAALDEVWPPKK
jgi:hypothetical protein